MGYTFYLSVSYLSGLHPSNYVKQYIGDTNKFLLPNKWSCHSHWFITAWFCRVFSESKNRKSRRNQQKINRKRPKKKTGNVLLLCLPPFFRLFMCKQISSEARKIYKSFFVCSWYDGEFNFRQNQIFKRLKEN